MQNGRTSDGLLKAPDDEAQEGDLADPVEKFLIGFSGRSVTRVIPRGQGIGTPPLQV